MVDELQITLDGKIYRLIEPEWSPGKTMYIHSHPEFVEPEWEAWEIHKRVEIDDDTKVWQELTDAEYERLTDKYWTEILDALRARSLMSVDGEAT
ncbi:MAG: hypothetical protein JEY79_17940 [Pseudodesulfovibrio sp.]|nr:hypothetical protein [Pseudodesulfovibrio sp.]